MRYYAVFFIGSYYGQTMYSSAGFETEGELPVEEVLKHMKQQYGYQEIRLTQEPIELTKYEYNTWKQ